MNIHKNILLIIDPTITAYSVSATATDSNNKNNTKTTATTRTTIIMSVLMIAINIMI